MNHKMVVYVLGRVTQIIGILMLLPAVVGLIYREKEIVPITITALIVLLAGGLLNLKKPKKTQIRAKEGFVITALVWIVMSIVGAIPFVVTGYIPSITDAVFETAQSA